MVLNERAGIEKLISLCRRSASNQQLFDLLVCFLTHEELESLGARINLITELLKGELSQREIATQLQVSIAKITRGSNMLKQTDPKLVKCMRDMLLSDL